MLRANFVFITAYGAWLLISTVPSSASVNQSSSSAAPFTLNFQHDI